MWPRVMEAKVFTSACLKEGLHVLLWRNRHHQGEFSMQLSFILCFCKGMQYTYLSAMLTTIEKKFGIKSKETAYLMSGNEIAQILFLFFLPLTLKVKKRPLWCGIGMMITGLEYE